MCNLLYHCQWLRVYYVDKTFLLFNKCNSINGLRQFGPAKISDNDVSVYSCSASASRQGTLWAVLANTKRYEILTRYDKTLLQTDNIFSNSINVVKNGLNKNRFKITTSHKHILFIVSSRTPAFIPQWHIECGYKRRNKPDMT